MARKPVDPSDPLGSLRPERRKMILEAIAEDEATAAFDYHTENPLYSVEGLTEWYQKIVSNQREKTIDRINAADKLADLRGMKKWKEAAELRRLSQPELEELIKEIVPLMGPFLKKVIAEKVMELLGEIDRALAPFLQCAQGIPNTVAQLEPLGGHVKGLHVMNLRQLLRASRSAEEGAQVAAFG